MFLLFIPAFFIIIGLMLLFPKKDRTKGKKEGGLCLLAIGVFFTVMIFLIDYTRKNPENKYYNVGTVVDVGSCRSADGFFSGNPGCTVLIKLESGKTRSAFVYDGAVKGMTVYQPCEDNRCDANWSNGRTLTEGHWASRK